MQISFAVVLGLLATSISAIPTPSKSSSSQAVTVQLVNDLTGASGSVSIRLDNHARDISALFGNTPIASHGRILASSVQLTKIVRGGACIITNAHHGVIADIDYRDTFDDLDGNANVAKPVHLDGASITCRKI